MAEVKRWNGKVPILAWNFVGTCFGVFVLYNGLLVCSKNFGMRGRREGKDGHMATLGGQPRAQQPGGGVLVGVGMFSTFSGCVLYWAHVKLEDFSRWLIFVLLMDAPEMVGTLPGRRSCARTCRWREHSRRWWSTRWWWRLLRGKGRRRCSKS